MSRRPTLVTFCVCTLLVLAGLLVAAASDRRDTAFAPGVPNNEPIALLKPDQRLCQGPLPVRGRFDALQLWAYPARSLELQVRTARGGQVLTDRRIETSPTPTGEITVPLATSALPSAERLTICVRNRGPQPIEFEGGPATGSSGDLSVSGQPIPGGAIALLFQRDRPPSLLSLLPTVFARAGLFKLDGVGAWAFWLLGGALLCAFPLAALAVAEALRADGEADREGA